MKKVIAYIKRQGGIFISCSSDGRSQYYELDNKVIRVSDHIGTNSKCFYSIICLNKGYLFWNYQTGAVNIVSYEDIKCFIRNIKILNTNDLSSEKINELQELIEKMNNYDEARILGVEASKFTTNQLTQIESFVKQAKYR